jgi:hypothetical protein
MVAPVTHILPLTNIRRERLLPVAGRVVVRAGQKVNATDVIAEARLESSHVLLDVRRGLGVPARQADGLIQRKMGETVSEGDVIAGPVGLFPRVMRAPSDGHIVAVGGGQVLLERQGGMFELRAGISGSVSELIADRGAVIETTGALVQGVWGNGRMDQGMLAVMVASPEEELTNDRLDVSMRGAVILGGYCGDAEALQTAASLPLRGLILASMPAELAPVALRLSMPVLVLEGFGRLAMNSVAFKILTTNDKREAIVNAELWDRFSGVRPEVVIPLPASGRLEAPHEGEDLVAGQTVRICRAPYTAMIGKIIALKPGADNFPSGVQSLAATVELESGEQIVVPQANLEIIA